MVERGMSVRVIEKEGEGMDCGEERGGWVIEGEIEGVDLEGEKETDGQIM